MRRAIADRLQTAIRPARAPRLTRWRPLLDAPSRGPAASGPRVLRLVRPGLRLRTILRSERHALARTLRMLVIRERMLRPAAPTHVAAPSPGPAAAGRASVRGLVAAPRITVVRPAPAQATVVVLPRLLRTVVRTRVERERTLERTAQERIERATAPGPDGPSAGRRGSRPPLVVRTLTSLQAIRSAQPVAEEAPEPAALPASIPASPAAAAVPVPDIDELVDRILRRIERRAIAQRERLGKA